MYRRLGGTKGLLYEQTIIFSSVEKETRIISWKQNFLYTTELYQQLGENLFSDRMSYRVLRSRWFNFIVLNVYASSEKKSSDSKNSLYVELEQVF